MSTNNNDSGSLAIGSSISQVESALGEFDCEYAAMLARRVQEDLVARELSYARVAELDLALERLAAKRAEREAAEAEQRDGQLLLKAAAPKLLAALQKITSVFERVGRVYMTEEQLEAMDEADAAISQATGEVV